MRKTPLFSRFRRVRQAVLLGGLMLPALLLAQGPAPTSVSITLPEAIHRAEQNEPGFASFRAEARAASLDRGIARAALLPGVIYHNQALYTQPNGARNAAGPVGNQPAPIFIANNAVREYASQASITETVGVAQYATVRVADANAARAAAELEITRRGLVGAVSGLFYGVLAGERRLRVLTGARDESQDFVSLTEKREAAREAAHADVIKAQLTLQQRTRDLADATLARDRARLELAVLLFPDPLTPFTVELPSPTPSLAAFADVQATARDHNPELASALAVLRQSDAEVLGAEAAYLPDLVLNFTYGIDATSFSVKSRFDGISNPRNLGYSFFATLDIPVWDWLNTNRRIKQSEYRRDAVRTALSAAQRRLIVNLQESYGEAQTAQSELASLEITVRTADQSLHLTRLRYESGEATVLEVVDAQTTLLNAQTAQSDGEVRFQQALASLQTLTGTL